ncbi:hypothetical protein [Streptomyces anandii]|uniref:hypothetical protein n=1 Tax=Streptomyces anandii TaxID=285454 RepID=UPI00379F0B55
MAMGSFVSLGTGAAFADGPHGATATGGSSGGDLYQQNIAQEGRQNSACDEGDYSDITLAPGRLTGRCVNGDGSFNKFARVRYSGARAEGGSSTFDLYQQNVAQRGRQNNACDDSVDLGLDVTDGALTTDCVNGDRSRNEDTFVASGGALARGGSGDSSAYQQNVAQEGRQNNVCNLSDISSPSLDPGTLTAGCVNTDASSSKHAGVKSRGARALGGSDGYVEQQNVAQEGRQNNACANVVDVSASVTDGDLNTWCVNKDRSSNEESLVSSGGARSDGGTSAGSLYQQTLAQDGRQNNACADGVDADLSLSGGREAWWCGNTDHSGNKRVLVKGAGAHAQGGSGLYQEQDTAQEGRQNNACGSATYWWPSVTNGRTGSGCGNGDGSRNEDVLVKGGGAHAKGGAGADGDVWQQSVAQEGRQNNACANLNHPLEGPPSLTDSAAEASCHNSDRSRNKKVLVKGGGAHVEGGSAAAELDQQNFAQEGRQNNACANLNSPEVTLTGSRAQTRCKTVDGSDNVETKSIGGGARVRGGSSAGSLYQQNVAQEGRQNNACDNHNHLDANITDGRQSARCVTVDRSVNRGTTTVGGGARVEGGSALGDLFQQNIAQEGRQNNACGNSNDLTITATGSRTDSQCLAVDRSVNVGSQED